MAASVSSGSGTTITSRATGGGAVGHHHALTNQEIAAKSYRRLVAARSGGCHIHFPASSSSTSPIRYCSSPRPTKLRCIRCVYLVAEKGNNPWETRTLNSVDAMVLY